MRLELVGGDLMILVGAFGVVLTRRDMKKGWVSVRGPSLAIDRRRHPTLFWIVASFNTIAGSCWVGFGLWILAFALIRGLFARA